jgi:hypothetical protein
MLRGSSGYGGGGAPAAAGGGGWSTAEPVTTLSTGDMHEFNAGLIDSLTHNGNGNYTLVRDRTITGQTFVQRSTYLWFDPFDGWSQAEWGSRILQIRVTITSDWTNKVDDVNHGICLNVGAKALPNVAMWHIKQRQTGGNGKLTAATATFSPTTLRNSTMTEAELASYMLVPGDYFQSQIDVDNINTGYNVGGGYTCALFLKQRVAGTGTDSLDFTIDKRYLEF